jgi:hypothetical protein
MAGGDHRAGRKLGGKKRTLEIGVDRLVPHRLAHLRRQARRKDRCAVHQDVDTSEPFYRQIYYPLGILDTGGISLYPHRCSSSRDDLRLDTLQRPASPAGEHNRSASLG